MGTGEVYASPVTSTLGEKKRAGRKSEIHRKKKRGGLFHRGCF